MGIRMGCGTKDLVTARGNVTLAGGADWEGAGSWYLGVYCR